MEGKSKEEIRKQLRAKRNQIPETDFIRKSQLIIKLLQQQEEYLAAEKIHCYVSMNGRREVNTHPLIKEMIANNKQVVVPVTNFQEQSLEHCKLESFDDLELNKWGVLEPREGEQYNLAALDLIIVPMVGGDEHAQRIGYGGGFYDRFLQDLKCPTIGLCFEQNMVSELPTESFDIPLDKIITESRIIISQQKK
ncbi:5-formyltetrahydrofolate cyclo-ligase [Fodinibius salsisoli]|uniref:5-formyltetrahydrofolate cyclo-ligase n=1 Tax=Fodinibius salsisoli TaxID=2820877 RepID=A0ABT3PM06_9BACT|nr:5-formyltetrahydrofolate cyclo-ligase [Fodinibius salsisoli]MCW9706798.1 5-formyltetrahydrofolate cyclo-ligase [Fodinibius salsisoli]